MNTARLIAATFILSFGQTVFAANVELLRPPLGAQTSLSRLTVDQTGQVYLSWVKSAGNMNSLYHASFHEEKWSNAGLIGEGDDWFVNWADFPFLAVNETGMAAHWPQMSSTGTYDYDVVGTFYSTATNTWTEPAVIHTDGVSAEHGFVSMLPMSQGRTFISWLDGRNTRQAESASPAATHHSGHSPGGMTLRAGIFSSTGQPLEEWELDNLVCDCCQTSSAMTESGPVVVYRNRTENEIRDTYITRIVDGQWSKPIPVHNDHWQISGCPVNGPSVASRSGTIAVTWFTAADDIPRVNLALSKDEGKTFSQPILIADNNTSGRLSIAILDSSDIAVSWLETHGAAATVKLGLYDNQGHLKQSLSIADTKSSRRSGFPVITSSGNDVYVTWTDVSAEPQVKVARVRF